MQATVFPPNFEDYFYSGSVLKISPDEYHSEFKKYRIERLSKICKQKDLKGLLVGFSEMSICDFCMVRKKRNWF